MRINLESIMVIHDKSEGFFDTTEQDLFVINIKTKLSLYSVMNEDTCSHTDFIIFIFPIGFEGDWDSIPSIPIYFSKSLSYSFDYPLGNQVWFLLEMWAKIQKLESSLINLSPS
mmetsp:Transcript_6733/g.7511  ORF Transcript_6733/g.7511 Transcript_6733/m.7511 type:complete len:114 (+) Transcript_6733:51-392(+)